MPLGAREGRPPARRFAVAGMLAGALALAAAELLAALMPVAPSPVLAVGEAVIDRMPAAIRDAAIGGLGALTKPLLIAGMLAVAAAAAAGSGVLASRHLALAAPVFGLLAAAGIAATATDPQASLPASAFAVVTGAAVGLACLRGLLRRAPAAGAGARRMPDDPPAFDRRAFGRLALATAAAAAAAGGGARLLAARERVAVQQRSVALPSPADPRPAPGQDLAREVDGVARLFTPNDEFFRIDTVLSVPRVDLDGWRLRVTGMVDRPLALDYATLLSEPLVEVDATITCVSNEVGGDLIGNARWLGVPLERILGQAGVNPLRASQVVGRSVDGWTAGFPTAVALDGRNALVAVGMNGEPLPLAHGFPVRLVVPGLYGYVSATKWLTEIELTTWEGYDAYWVPRGWSKEGPVKTQSRIDVPRRGTRVAEGPGVIAGVAWAPTRGIAAVEVRVDDGPWREATLAEELHPDSWRQWRLDWDASPGEHTLTVRATDGAGEVQTAERAPPQPDGATGWHTTTVQVSA